jgi:hypothetical protein
MFGDSEDDEKLKNFILFKFWGTDDELSEVAPILGGILLVSVIIGTIVYFLS